MILAPVFVLLLPLILALVLSLIPAVAVVISPPRPGMRLVGVAPVSLRLAVGLVDECRQRAAQRQRRHETQQATPVANA